MEQPPIIRKMPRPWFNAQSCATPLCARMDKTPGRPLAAGEEALGVFIIPPFQRPAVWTRAQEIRLIESLWGGLPIGTCVVNFTGYPHPTDGWLLDGQQRWRAIYAYVADEFPVLGYRYSELSVIDHRGFEMATVFPELQTRMVTEAECRDVYDRLAYGGTPHEPRSPHS